MAYDYEREYGPREAMPDDKPEPLPPKHQVASELLALAFAIQARELSLADRQARRADAQARFEFKEAQLLLGETITGTNAESRAAQVALATQAEEEQVRLLEHQVCMAKASLMGLHTRFVALLTVARLGE